MGYTTILTEVADGVAVITLNRPDRLNAWTHTMGAELAAAIEAANADDAVGAIVVTGAGRGFCAGADIAEVFQARVDEPAPPPPPTPAVDPKATVEAAMPADPRVGSTPADGPAADPGLDPNLDPGLDFGAGSGEAVEEVRVGDWVELTRRSKPLVAAVNGAAVGVGLTQILSMDYIVAARGAKLSMRFVKMGLVPELASSHFLPLRVGFGHASELMLSGRTLLAEEAVGLGLVDRLVEPEELLDVARSVAASMGENPQSSLAMIKDLLTENVAETSLREIQRRELRALDQAYETPEHAEAVAAFLEKRPPDYRAARAAASAVPPVSDAIFELRDSTDPADIGLD